MGKTIKNEAHSFKIKTFEKRYYYISYKNKENKLFTLQSPKSMVAETLPVFLFIRAKAFSGKVIRQVVITDNGDIAYSEF